MAIKGFVRRIESARPGGSHARAGHALPAEGTPADPPGEPDKPNAFSRHMRHRRAPGLSSSRLEKPSKTKRELFGAVPKVHGASSRKAQLQTISRPGNGEYR